ncbi:Uncharacterized conserved protein YecT, DUF1311 family [Chitinophaga terrae (ex Kim and Jung 2007)]|uniref:Uncharacterized conserved protein YecT, DUF1311 family n=2 Tax=Chitinophaga terrae (ex Kim and Jung 2007) TaxID=408074 RepID=A0A1H4FUB9_9BACT|nr:hypothetical protein CTE07_44610 [Chitinophaga terrae (ex Kim and Jung 2007)]SEB00112.1 Uncharacterized conserved protein YecT, DUF1311 family [Chitinophaga terrae (ex Kim and Jung 2007)]
MFIFSYICRILNVPMRNLFLLTLLLLGSGAAYSQTSQASLDSLEQQYQECLGSSTNMYDCALNYYKQLDSLLTNTLQQLYTNLDKPQQQQLEQEQAAWEEKKEEYFKKIDERVEKMHKRTMEGLDDEMISTDNKAAFLKQRLTTLLSI